jgi:hypothetical protein
MGKTYWLTGALILAFFSLSSSRCDLSRTVQGNASGAARKPIFRGTMATRKP